MAPNVLDKESIRKKEKNYFVECQPLIIFSHTAPPMFDKGSISKAEFLCRLSDIDGFPFIFIVVSSFGGYSCHLLSTGERQALTIFLSFFIVEFQAPMVFLSFSL